MMLQIKERFMKAINLFKTNLIDSSDDSDEEKKRSWKYLLEIHGPYNTSEQQYT